MLKILKNLKQSWISVLAIVLLLCLQAAVDLELPNYTSKIVNEGIQSGGIEDAVPNEISMEDMEAILLVTEDDNQILSKYSTENGKYIIKDIDTEERKVLSSIMIEPIIISQTLKIKDASILENVKTLPDSIKEQTAVAYVKNIYQNAGVDTTLNTADDTFDPETSTSWKALIRAS